MPDGSHRRRAGQGARVLLVANNFFPPVRGGSASVHANLVCCACNRVVVLAPSIDYGDGLLLTGWRKHDRRAPDRVPGVTLLRTTT